MVMRVVYFLGIVCPILLWVLLCLCCWLYFSRYDRGYEDGKLYVRNILIQETDSLIKSQKLFPDNPKYQSLIDQWYKDGTLPVKE